jgi:hypothetical protein
VRFLLDKTTAGKLLNIPHKQVTVNEAMIPIKGHLSIKQYMKDKPVKFGIKVWLLADVATAYCHNFEVNIGKNAEIVTNDFGLSSKVVIGFTKHLEMKGYEMYMDNFYISPQLAKYLYGRDTYLCSTLRTNRKGYLKELVQTNAAARCLQRGQSDWRMCGPLLASYWKDSRMVYYLLSCHEPEGDMTTQHRAKDGTAQEILCTPTVETYAKYVGGVDCLTKTPD